MVNPSFVRRLTLRAKLVSLNVIVVVAMLLLAIMAWRMSGLQDEAHARQADLAEALSQSKQADMAHDALRSDVLASLLVGSIPEITQAETLRHLADDRSALENAMVSLAKISLPQVLAQRVAKVHQQTRSYADVASQIVTRGVLDRSGMIATLPRFNAQFNQLKQDLEVQSNEVSAVLGQTNLESAGDAAAQRIWMAWICAITICFASAIVALTTIYIRQRLAELGHAAQAIADGDLDRRADGATKDELGKLGAAINRMAVSLSGMIEGMREDTRRATLGHQLAEALEMADREQQVCAVAARAMAEVAKANPMELLIADSSRAQMEQAAEHPAAGGPGCGVRSPYDCVAVRRGSIVAFEDSDDLNACAQLRGRSCGKVSAVCVPVTFMGRAIGVLHATGPVDEPLSAEQADQLGTMGAQLGVRIGTVRAFEQTQIQAATDALTGLANRRSVEQRLRSIAASKRPYALVMCDLDHFKRLNDTYGHASGDSALRVFTEVLRSSVREGDVAGRWGGEEFMMVLNDCYASEAHEIIDRMRQKLAEKLELGTTPAFTASFGIADSTMSDETHELIQLADGALYLAKESGRDRACIADPTPQGVQPVARRAELAGTGLELELAAVH